MLLYDVMRELSGRTVVVIAQAIKSHPISSFSNANDIVPTLVLYTESQV